MMLGVLDQLASTSLLLGSPQATTLLIAPLPGAEAEAGITAEGFVKKLQVRHARLMLLQQLDLITMGP